MRHWETVRGHHLRASFHKVLSSQSSRQDTGSNCCLRADYSPPTQRWGSQGNHSFSTLVSSKSLQTPSYSSGRYFLLSADSLLHGLLYSVCQVFWDLALWNPQIIFLLTKSSSFKGRSGLTDLCNTLQAPVLKVESWTMSSLSQLIVCLPPEVMESLASMRETPRATRMRRKWK